MRVWVWILQNTHLEINILGSECYEAYVLIPGIQAKVKQTIRHISDLWVKSFKTQIENTISHVR